MAVRAAGQAPKRQTQAQRREKAEQAMLAACLEIIAERGVEELTLAEAGERAGYSRALPSHYFDSKDAALAGVADLIVEKYLRRAQRTIVEGQGLDAFINRLAHYFDDGRKDPRVLRAFHAILGAAPGKPALARSAARLTEETKRTYAAFIRDGIRHGDIRRDAVPEVEAVWILASLRGVMAQWVIAPERTPLAKVRDAFLANVRRALQA